MSSKYDRKRKNNLDADTTIDGERKRHRSSRSRSRSPAKRSPKKQRRESKPSRDDAEGGDRNEESLSIEETNKLRAKLGLAPLELEDKTNTEPVEKDDGSGEKVFTEDGVEIVHKPSRNWADEKRQKDLKEKLETRKKQRDVYSKVLKSKKGLADESDNEELGDTAKWIERNRRMEEEMRKAQERAKQLDEMDEAFGIGGIIQAAQQKKSPRKKQKNDSLTGGLVVGHSVNDFSEGRETVLVLQDKSILDEDNDDEVLINPNMLENERHKLNVERRKKTASHYQAFEEEMDEFGQVKQPEILSKYDEGLDGDAKKRQTFRLDATGQYDLDKEAQEMEAKRRLMMMNKKFESLESTKYTLAKEFYTEEELIQFRRPKKGKGTKSMRKKKVKALKAEDLVVEPVAETEAEKRAREVKLAARRAENGSNGAKAEDVPKFHDTLKAAEAADAEPGIEEGELVDEKTAPKKLTKEEAKKLTKEEAEIKSDEIIAGSDKEKWKKPKANVDIQMLSKLVEKIKRTEENDEEDEDEDEVFPHVTNVAPVIIDDEAEEELTAMLAKARRLKQAEQQQNGMNGVNKFALKMEDDDQESSSEDEEATSGGAIIFDATSEKYKSIGGINIYADVKKEMKLETIEEEDEEMETETRKPSSSNSRKTKHRSRDKEQKKKKKHKKASREEEQKSRKRKAAANEGDDLSDFERMEVDREGASSEDDDMDSKTYTNILGEERDVTKGVAAMLKLAGEKGYLESGQRRRAGEGSLKHLESKRFSKVEQGRYDIEDKTMRKLERMGTTGTGPTRPFPEKEDYQPKIEINYADKSGRVLEPKEAFRIISWKFHGKGPGKKQAEKHTLKVVKREKLKKMNSQDTPLGTLNKQLKKQEQLQTPYLVLSGRGDSAPLQKE